MHSRGSRCVWGHCTARGSRQRPSRRGCLPNDGPEQLRSRVILYSPVRMLHLRLLRWSKISHMPSVWRAYARSGRGAGVRLQAHSLGPLLGSFEAGRRQLGTPNSSCSSCNSSAIRILLQVTISYISPSHCCSLTDLWIRLCSFAIALAQQLSSSGVGGSGDTTQRFCVSQRAHTIEQGCTFSLEGLVPDSHTRLSS